MENLYNRYNCWKFENIVAKGEIAHFDQFFLLSRYFQETSPADASECDYRLERVKFQVWIAGYGIESDLKMLLKTLPYLHGAFVHAKRIINLEVIANKVGTQEVIALVSFNPFPHTTNLQQTTLKKYIYTKHEKPP